MTRTYRKYTNEDIIKYSKEVKSIAGLIKKLGLKTVGGNYYTIKKRIQELKVDTKHWTGQAWNKNEQLKDWSQYAKTSSFKPHLIKIRGCRCEGPCKRISWNRVPIPLDVHHIDGNRTNNKIENLLLLCPNCHHQAHH